MEKLESHVACGGCGISLGEPTSQRAAEGEPCPQCGSLLKHITIQVEEGWDWHESLGVKTRHGESGKPFHETLTGEDLQVSSGRWMRKERIVDRENDRYFERVEDPETGTVIHQCDEPLSEHRGHGSAKHR